MKPALLHSYTILEMLTSYSKINILLAMRTQPELLHLCYIIDFESLDNNYFNREKRKRERFNTHSYFTSCVASSMRSM